MKNPNAKSPLDRLEQQIISEESVQQALVKRQLEIQNMRYECDAILYFKRR